MYTLLLSVTVFILSSDFMLYAIRNSIVAENVTL